MRLENSGTALLGAPQAIPPDSLYPPADSVSLTLGPFTAEDLITAEGLQGIWETMRISVIQNSPRLFSALLTLVFFYLIYRLAYRILRGALKRSPHVRHGLGTIILQTFRLVTSITIGLMVFDQAGLDIATILAGVGVAGIALSFAARDTLENVISGVSILADGSLDIGDFVIVQGTYGTVTDITLRATRVKTQKNEVLIVPNKMIATEAVLNHSTYKNLRVEILFSIGYEENPEEVRKILSELPKGDPKIREDIASEVVVKSLGSSGIDMALWIYPKEVKHERSLIRKYTEGILYALREADIEIPYPHIHLKTDQKDPKK